MNTCPVCGEQPVGMLRKSFGPGRYTCRNCGATLGLPTWRYLLLVPAALIVGFMEFPLNIVVASVLVLVLMGIWMFIPFHLIRRPS